MSANDDARRLHSRAESRIASRRDEFAKQAQGVLVDSMEFAEIPLPNEDSRVMLYKTTFSDGTIGMGFVDEKNGRSDEYFFHKGKLSDDEYGDIEWKAGGWDDYPNQINMQSREVAQVLDTLGLPYEYWKFYLSANPDAGQDDVEYEPIEE